MFTARYGLGIYIHFNLILVVKAVLYLQVLYVFLCLSAIYKEVGQSSFLDLLIVNIFRFRSDIKIFIAHKYRVFLFILFPSMTLLLHRRPDSLAHPVTRVKITCTKNQTPLNNVNRH